MWLPTCYVVSLPPYALRMSVNFKHIQLKPKTMNYVWQEQQWELECWGILGKSQKMLSLALYD